mmetsp:Transcript_20028/g.28963  ORF Transcript_20028/g.28963 Transcript_20028/m.28963 type:complete len:93 (-) Transcript_20028:680-958(-)
MLCASLTRATKLGGHTHRRHIFILETASQPASHSKGIRITPPPRRLFLVVRRSICIRTDVGTPQHRYQTIDERQDGEGDKDDQDGNDGGGER